MIFISIIVVYLGFIATVGALCILDSLYLDGSIANRVKRWVNQGCNQDCSQGRNCNCGR
jgi:hypothetical protein